MNVSVIGTGYVGLVTGVCLAETGLNVICMDTDKNKIEKLKEGQISIFEPGLKALVDKNLASGRLKFTVSIEEAVQSSKVIFIAVNTPTVNNRSDLKYVIKASRDIALCMKDFKTVVMKSTVPVGTCKKVKKEIRALLDAKKKDIKFDIVSNPEFLREGTAVRDFMSPDRIVIGADSERSIDIMREIYASHESSGVPLVITNLETSELIKYACNTFLASKISFINEVSNICDLCGADVTAVSRAMGLDKRIGPLFLNPGPGYGGSCLPKDTRAFIGIGRELGYVSKIINSTVKVNEDQIKRSVKKIKRALGTLKNKSIAVLGASFKPDTDDIRESPSIKIIKKLLKKKAKINLTDPIALDNVKALYPNLKARYFNNAYDACTKSDCIVLVTEWEDFKNLDFTYLKSIVHTPLIIDLKNVYEPDYIRSLGFIYIGVGRP